MHHAQMLSADSTHPRAPVCFRADFVRMELTPSIVYSINIFAPAVAPRGAHACMRHDTSILEPLFSSCRDQRLHCIWLYVAACCWVLAIPLLSLSMLQSHILCRRLALPLLLCPRNASAFLSPRRTTFHQESHRLMVTAPHLVNTVETLSPGDWDDRIALQQSWSNPEKGWKVDVEWKMTSYGVGLFAAQDITKGTVMRTGIVGRNLKQLRSIADIEALTNNDEYDARLRYVADYLWGFHTSGTDEQGYCNTQEEHTRFYGMWIPGNGLNHSPNPNTVYRTSKNGIDLVALTHIQPGDECLDDYRRHGRAPEWLLEFAKEKQVTLNFSECNDFVDSYTR